MNFTQARRNMIEQQIRPWEVLDQRVLDVLARIPREDYVPAGYRNLAFADTGIPLGRGEVMMAPKVEARLLQALSLAATDQVFEIGTGSGYLSACLAAMAGHVTSMDIVAEFVRQARTSLANHGMVNAALREGDALAALEGGAQTYDVIAVSGSLPVMIDSLRKALKSGGRLFAIVGEAPVMEALLFTCVGEKEWLRESLFETVIPALRNAPQPQRFAL